MLPSHTVITVRVLPDLDTVCVTSTTLVLHDCCDVNPL